MPIASQTFPAKSNEMPSHSFKLHFKPIYLLLEFPPTNNNFELNLDLTLPSKGLKKTVVLQLFGHSHVSQYLLLFSTFSFFFYTSGLNLDMCDVCLFIYLNNCFGKFWGTSASDSLQYILCPLYVLCNHQCLKKKQSHFKHRWTFMRNWDRLVWIGTLYFSY